MMRPINPFTDPSDKLGFSKVLDKYSKHLKNESDEFIDFLDPHSLAIYMGALKKHMIKPAVYGGYDGSERNMMGFISMSNEFPSENITVPSLDVEDVLGLQNVFPITPILITFNERFSSPPTHRHYLGSLIGLGLERGKLGDICLTKEGAIVYAHSSIADFVTGNLVKVGKTSVKASMRQSIIESTLGSTLQRLTVSSLRLDAFIAAAYNLSRTKANELIDSKKVFVNFRLEKKTHILKVYDKISVRGFGRVEIVSTSGITKKGKIALEVTKFL